VEIGTPGLRERLQNALGDTYTLERELGGGGMSHVFVAHDATLERDVVVKVLPPDAAAALSAERFKREIALAARLQHPHIVPVLAAGTTSDGLPFYTMPFVEGESLRARLARTGELPVPETISVLKDVARALAYAHARGIVHRDIKPDNVLITGGAAVVTDFGVAKAVSASTTSGDATSLTQLGVALGTPAYMAPEQVAADPAVDHRADLYALGCVAYELLTGQPPFTGRPVQSLLAAHVSEAPESVERRRRNVPPAIAALVMRLLEKRPADRLQSADDVLRALDATGVVSGDTPAVSIASASDGARATRAASAPKPWPTPLADARVAWLVASIALVAAAVLGVASWRNRAARSGASAAMPLARLSLDLPADARLNPNAVGSAMAFSPDGSAFVYVGGTPEPHFFLRRLDELAPRSLPGTELASRPRFSPNGRWIGFVTGFITGPGTLKRIPVDGGSAETLVEGVERYAWAPDGSIVFSRPSTQRGPRAGLWLRTAAGAVEQLTTPDPARELRHDSPVLLADGRTVVFVSWTLDRTLTLSALRLDDRRVVPLGLVGANPVAVGGDARGQIVAFVRPDRSVGAVMIDNALLRTTSEVVSVLDRIYAEDPRSGDADLAVAPNGTLLYRPPTNGAELVEVTRRGEARTIVSRAQAYGPPRVSPDGRRIASVVFTAGRPVAGAVWVYDRTSETLTRLTETGTGGIVEWTPDGRRVAWSDFADTTRGGALGGIWWRPVDASAPAEPVIPDGRGVKFLGRGDSATIVLRLPNGSADVRLVPVPYTPGAPVRVLLPPGFSRQPQHRPSPDGQWLAYVSEETGAREVYVQRMRGGSGRYQVSAGGGVEPVWSPDGTELFYRGGDALLSARLATTPEFTVLRRDTLFAMNARFYPTEASYDVTPDGKHFVFARPLSIGVSPVLVFGWGDEVRARLTKVEGR
jgi:serine/threonine-protein kinase